MVKQVLELTSTWLTLHCWKNCMMLILYKIKSKSQYFKFKQIFIILQIFLPVLGHRQTFDQHHWQSNVFHLQHRINFWFNTSNYFWHKFWSKIKIINKRFIKNQIWANWFSSSPIISKLNQSANVKISKDE